MKKFLKKLLVFFLPAILLAWPLDYILSSRLRRSHDYGGVYEVWNDIYNGEIRCDIAIYGSSRAWVQFNPSIMQNELGRAVYNFGMDGQTFWLEYMQHLEYLDNNTAPTQIILEMDIFSLTKKKELYNLEQFLPYMAFNENMRKYTSSYEGFNKGDFYVPLLRYFGKYDAIDKALHPEKDLEKYRIRGFRGQDRDWNNDLEDARREMDGFYAKIDTASVELFRKFAKDCCKKQILLTLVYPPEYIEGQEFITNRQEVLQLFNELAAEFNLRFFDFSNDPICWDRKYFYNATHLNARGADLFTRKFCDRLKQLNELPNE